MEIECNGKYRTVKQIVKETGIELMEIRNDLVTNFLKQLRRQTAWEWNRKTIIRKLGMLMRLDTKPS